MAKTDFPEHCDLCEEILCADCEGCTCGDNLNGVVCECGTEEDPYLPFETPDAEKSLV